MDKGWEKFPDSRGRTQGPPSTYANRFYYDTVVFKDTHLRFLIDTVGIDRMVFGTDWPAPMDVDDPVRRIEGSAGARPRRSARPSCAGTRRRSSAPLAREHPVLHAGRQVGPRCARDDRVDLDLRRVLP